MINCRNLALRSVLSVTVAAVSMVALSGGSSMVTTAFASTCTPAQATTDVPTSTPGFPDPSFSTDAGIQNDFNFGRTHDGEGCGTSLVLPGNYDTLDPQHQMLTLFNLERTDRGLGTLQLDTTLMSQIDFNHAAEMAQYGYFEHNGAINQPGGDTSPFARLNINPAISSAQSSEGENIAAGYSTAAAATYGYMYDDSSSGWGHRNNILGSNGTTTYGNFNWLGVGYVHKLGSVWGFYYVDDFMQSGSTYTPPATVDTTAPTLNTPTYNGTTASVTNVQDTGAATGAAGVTGVVFYVDSVTDSSPPGNGVYNTVAATRAGSTWTAAISVPAGHTLHAVAVDGSGNYTDCTAASCAPTAAPVAFFRARHAAAHHGRAEFAFSWRVVAHSGIVGFNVIADGRTLNRRLIAAHPSASYTWTATATIGARFALEIINRDGRRVAVPNS